MATGQLDEASIGAIDTAASYCRTLWATFIGYAATLFILASGTTHEALLRETPVKLPLFNVESGIPLVLFYVIAPLLLVLFHLNLLLKLHDLRVRVRAVTEPLRTAVGEEGRELRVRLRRIFTSFDYALLESGLTERREGVLLRIVTNATVFVIPVLLLLFVQLQFLPYHDAGTTWFHRALIATDLALIALVQFWLGRERPEGSRVVRRPLARSGNMRLVLGRTLVFAVPVFASLFVLAFPGEPQDLFWRAAWTLARGASGDGDLPRSFSALAGADFAERFGIRRSLYLADRDLWAENPTEDLLQALTEDVTIIALREDAEGVPLPLARTVQRIRNAALNLKGRNLAYANFENARLIAADFRPDLNNEEMRAFEQRSANDDLTGNRTVPAKRSNITGASFSGADLKGAKFSFASGTRADFRGANLQSAVLAAGEFEGADFRFAAMQGADLSRGRLRSAVLSDAELQNARLFQADLQGADLSGAVLPGLDFHQAQLQGADLSNARLQGAFLNEARLQGALLTDAQLQGADLAHAEMQGAAMNRANLKGASLEAAQLQGADLTLADLSGADLSFASLQGADFSEAVLIGADFTGAAIRGADFRGVDLSLANFSRAGAVEGYEFGSLRALAGAIADPGRRAALLARIEQAQSRIEAGPFPPASASGDEVWAGDPVLLGEGVHPAADLRAYAAAWARFVVDLGCAAQPDDGSDFAARAITKRLSARARSLDETREAGFRTLGRALAEALVATPCARARLVSEEVEELEAAIRAASGR